MTTDEIITAIYDYLTFDSDYSFIPVENADGTTRLDDSYTFDISNTNHKEHFAPYFRIDNIKQAKEIFKAIAPGITDVENDVFFEKVMATKSTDLSKEIYLSIYRPNRRKIK